LKLFFHPGEVILIFAAGIGVKACMEFKCFPPDKKRSSLQDFKGKLNAGLIQKYKITWATEKGRQRAPRENDAL